VDPEGQSRPDPLPPRSGYRRRSARVAGRVHDELLEARQRLRRVDTALDEAAALLPARRVTVRGVYGEDGGATIAAAVRELARSRHEPDIRLAARGATDRGLAAVTALEHQGGGKLANLNRLIDARAQDADWVLLIDDDVALRERFLDRFLLLAERFRLHLAQPALSHTSHTAWPVVRRRASLLRLTRFVEMGPVVLMRAEAFAELAPFPEDGMGWGICLHWAAVAARSGWRVGIADAVPARHDVRPPARGYDREEARAGAAELLRGREHIGWREAETVLATYREL
jgi:hypothetical protein